MSERDGAAIHVELLLRDTDLPANALDATERLVHLEQIHRIDGPSGALEDASDRAARREEKELRFARVLRLRDQTCDRRGAQLARAVRGRDDERRRAVVQL